MLYDNMDGVSDSVIFFCDILIDVFFVCFKKHMIYREHKKEKNI